MMEVAQLRLWKTTSLIISLSLQNNIFKMQLLNKLKTWACRKLQFSENWSKTFFSSWKSTHLILFTDKHHKARLTKRPRGQILQKKILPYSRKMTVGQNGPPNFVVCNCFNLGLNWVTTRNEINLISLKTQQPVHFQRQLSINQV